MGTNTTKTMKKVLYSLLAIAAFASCAKTGEVPSDGIEIKIAPITKMQTKANYLGAVDGNAYPANENFDVYAYWKEVPAGETFTDGILYLQSEKEADSGAEFTNRGEYWGGVEMYFWPKTGSLRFAAYSPSHLNVTHSQDGDKYSIYEYTQPTQTDKTWDFLVAPTTPSYSMMTETEKVAVDFKHALSWITIKVRAQDAYAAQAFEIKKVTINNVKTKGDFVASMTDGIQYEEWSNQSGSEPVVVFEGSQMVTETLANIENNERGTVVIPQSTTDVTIEFVQHGINGTTTLPLMSQTLSLDLKPQGTPWGPGKHYNYKLIFSLNEILIKPTVSDWTEVNLDEKDIDN
jgi:hypothetical protein